jgi:hypothetical protein
MTAPRKLAERWAVRLDRNATYATALMPDESAELASIVRAYLSILDAKGVTDAMVAIHVTAVNEHLGSMTEAEWQADRRDKHAHLARVARIGLEAVAHLLPSGERGGVRKPDGYTALLSDGKRYWADAPGEYGDWRPYFLDHPPAQAAQVVPEWLIKGLRLIAGTNGAEVGSPRGKAAELLARISTTAEPVAQGEAVPFFYIDKHTAGAIANPMTPSRDGVRAYRPQFPLPDGEFVPVYLQAAQPRAAPDGCDVVVDPQGVRFGKNCWMSHEKITGRSAESLNNGGGVIGPAYMEWVRAMLAAAPQHGESA